MPRHQRNIDVAALADRLAVVHCFEHREAARMFLHQPRNRIQVTSPRVGSERLPLRETRRARLSPQHRCRRRNLARPRPAFHRSRDRPFRSTARRRPLPLSVNEMTEATPVLVQPGQDLFGIFRRRPVFHAHKFFSNAHARSLDCYFQHLRHRMPVLRGVPSGRMMLQLPLDISQQAARPEAEHFGSQPRRAQALL